MGRRDRNPRTADESPSGLAQRCPNSGGATPFALIPHRGCNPLPFHTGDQASHRIEIPRHCIKRGFPGNPSRRALTSKSEARPAGLNSEVKSQMASKDDSENELCRPAEVVAQCRSGFRA